MTRRPWKLVAPDGRVLGSYSTQVAAVWHLNEHPGASVAHAETSRCPDCGRQVEALYDHEIGQPITCPDCFEAITTT